MDRQTDRDKDCGPFYNGICPFPMGRGIISNAPIMQISLATFFFQIYQNCPMNNKVIGKIKRV